MISIITKRATWTISKIRDHVLRKMFEFNTLEKDKMANHDTWTLHVTRNPILMIGMKTKGSIATQMFIPNLTAIIIQAINIISKAIKRIREPINQPQPSLG